MSIDGVKFRRPVVPGDQIRVQVKIKEGDKERLQAFEGLVIAINRGLRARSPFAR